MKWVRCKAMYLGYQRRYGEAGRSLVISCKASRASRIQRSVWRLAATTPVTST
jgi:hypothetical protein